MSAIDPLTIATPLQMLAYLRSVPVELRMDEEWLTAMLSQHCRLGNYRALQMSRLRIIQLPNEFARFCIWCAQRDIRSYLEVGVSTGGSWLFLDAYLRAFNPQFIRSVGYDDQDKLRGFAEYAAAVKTVKFYHQNSKFMEPDGQFDLAFVDGNHKLKHVRRDFIKVSPYARYVAFHDIVWGDVHGGVREFWDEIKKVYRHVEFIDNKRNGPACGIGIIDTLGGQPIAALVSASI